LHDEVHVTTVFVTHDQEEALEVADRIVVINAGRIEQVGTPDDLYDAPVSEFVMSFLGPVTTLDGHLIRPHDIAVSVEPRPGHHAGTITRYSRIGFEVRVEVGLTEQPDAPAVLATMTRTEAASLGLADGVRVWLARQAGAPSVVIGGLHAA
jgi:sulfate transport system ATP-binding protein